MATLQLHASSKQKMSLFQFGFQRVVHQERVESRGDEDVPDHMPSVSDSGLGSLEYSQVSAAVSELADPSPAKKRRARGTYMCYTAAQRAQIGRYALENGNERARKRFMVQFPNLCESTVRNFKKAYAAKLHLQKKQLSPQPKTEIPGKLRGRPPILLELDEKLIKFLRAIRSKGGVVNIHVVRASTKALIESNPAVPQHLRSFNMPHSWVHSVYKRMGYVKRTGTTTHPPVPQGLYDECRREYLGDIDSKIKKYKIPKNLFLTLIKHHHPMYLLESLQWQHEESHQFLLKA